MEKKLKKFSKRLVCGVIVCAMLISCAFAATYSMDSFLIGDGYTRTVSGSKVPVTVIKTIDGVQSTDTPQSILAIKNNDYNSSLTQTLVSYQIPEIVKNTVDLVAYNDVNNKGVTFVNFKPSDNAEGFVVEKAVDTAYKNPGSAKAGMTVGKAIVAEQNGDGSLKLLTDEEGMNVLSDDDGIVTATAVWENYLFVAMTFWKTYNIDYYTNLVVYDMADLSTPVAEWNMRDLGFTPIDAYEVHHQYMWQQFWNDRRQSLDGDHVKWANIAYQTQIQSIYVTDDSIFLARRDANLSMWGNQGNARKYTNRKLGISQYENPINLGTKPGADVVLDTPVAVINAEQIKGAHSGVNGDTVGLGNDISAVHDSEISMKRIGDKLAIVNCGRGQYMYGDLADGVLTKVTNPIANNNQWFDDILVQDLEGSPWSRIGDIDWEGEYAYITHKTDGYLETGIRDSDDGKTKNKGRINITKVDFTDPTSPKFVYRYEHIDYITSNGQVYGIKPDFSMNGEYGYLTATGQIGSNSNPNWLITLDMSNREEGISEIARYNTLPMFQTHSQGSTAIRQAVVGDYIFFATSDYGKRPGLGIYSFNEDKSAVTIADFMYQATRVNDSIDTYCINSNKAYNGDVYTFYTCTGLIGTNSGERPFHGAVFVKTNLTELTRNYVSQINDPIIDGENIVISGKIYEKPYNRQNRLDIYTLNIDINGTVYKMPVSKIAKDGTWSYTIDGYTLSPNELTAVKVYPTFVEVTFDEEDYDDGGVGFVTKYTTADKHYDQVEFVMSELPFRITDVSFSNTDREVTVNYVCNEEVTGRPIAALYKDGILAGITYSDSDVTITDGVVESIVINAPDDWDNITGSTVRLFIWENGTIKPLTKSVNYRN